MYSFARLSTIDPKTFGKFNNLYPVPLIESASIIVRLTGQRHEKKKKQKKKKPQKKHTNKKAMMTRDRSLESCYT